jgi:hypothetical protein
MLPTPDLSPCSPETEPVPQEQVAALPNAQSPHFRTILLSYDSSSSNLSSLYEGVE